MSYRHLVVACLAGCLLSCEQPQQSQLPVVQLSLTEPCDIQRGCRLVGKSITATVIFATDVRGLQPFPVKVLLDTTDEVESMTVAFSMQGMDMGWNRYSLSGDAMSAWNASVTLPVCSSGRMDWVADFDLLAAGRDYRFQVPFVLDK